MLKILRDKKNIVREFRRCKERGHMLWCLVMCISLIIIYYVHAQARYISLATILRNNHVCGVSVGFSNILSAGGSTLVPGRAASRLLNHHHAE